MTVSDNIHRAFGGALRRARKQQGWTQEQLAERSDLSYKCLGEIERGTGNPTLDTMARLAGALDVSLSGLLALSVNAVDDHATLQDLQIVRDAVTTLEAVVQRLMARASPLRF